MNAKEEEERSIAIITAKIKKLGSSSLIESAENEIGPVLRKARRESNVFINKRHKLLRIKGQRRAKRDWFKLAHIE